MKEQWNTRICFMLMFTIWRKFNSQRLITLTNICDHHTKSLNRLEGIKTFWSKKNYTAISTIIIGPFFLRRIKWSWHMMKSVSLTFCYCLVQRKLLYTSSCGFEPGLRYYLVVILVEQNFYLSESLFRQWQKYKKTLTHSTFTPFLHWRNSYARSQMSQLEILTIDKNFELVYMSVRYTLGSSLICHDT